MDTLSRITPYLCAQNAAAAIAFYKSAFGAVETMRLDDPDGRVAHAEILIANVPVFVSDEYPEIGVLSPTARGGSPVMMVLETPDADGLFARAVSAGATVDRPMADQFHGEFRNGKLVDPYGHRWMLLTRLRPAADASL
jgi:PhnB protein